MLKVCAYAQPAELFNAILFFGFLLILSELTRSRTSIRGENHRDIGGKSVRKGARFTPYPKVFPSSSLFLIHTLNHALSLGGMSRPFRSELRAFVVEAK